MINDANHKVSRSLHGSDFIVSQRSDHPRPKGFSSDESRLTLGFLQKYHSLQDFPLCQDDLCLEPSNLNHSKNHQTFQVPKMEVLTYISSM